MAATGFRRRADRFARRAGALAAASAALLAAAPSASAISHGTGTRAGAAPWMATLAFPHKEPLTKTGYCGGTLIAPDRVLTAGHCVMDKPPTDFRVHLGADRLSKAHGQGHKVRGWFWHPGWREVHHGTDTFGAHDMAVVVLDHPVRGARPVPIASPAQVRAAVARGRTGTAYGHGGTEHTDPAKGAMADRLRRGTMKLLPPKQCASDVPRESVGKTGFCTTGVPARHGAAAPSICPGDSGGPLMLSTPGGPEVAGVLSAQSGDGCDGSVHQGEFMNPSGWRHQALRPHPELAPTGTLHVTGAPAVGHRLNASVAGLKPTNATVRYAWYREKDDGDGFTYYVPVEGADSRSLTVTKGLAGTHLKVIATLKSPAGRVRLDRTVAP